MGAQGLVEKYLARVEQARRVQGILYTPHGRNAFGAMLALHRLSLAQPDAMLARACAAHRERVVDHGVVDDACLVPVGGIVRSQYKEYVEIAVANMAKYGREQTRCFDGGFGAGDGIAIPEGFLGGVSTRFP